MKYVIILADGMAGEPLESLLGKTTMEAANTPMMDELAKDSEIGMACMVPDDMEPGSDVANLSVLGYDPDIYYTGRSSLEALSLGIHLKENEVSVRANLVTLSKEEACYEKKKMLDHSAGEISTQDAAVLIDYLKRDLCTENFTLYEGTGYRHLLVCKNKIRSGLTPPHNILLKEIKDDLPKDDQLRDMMERSWKLLKDHPVNQLRNEKGIHSADSLWFWGEGTCPKLDSFYEKTGKKASMISAVDLLKGIANGTGMRNIIVDGANAGLYTNYKGKAEAALKALEEGDDFVYIHIEAPDEMGHQGLVREKIHAIEKIDCEIVKNVVCGLRNKKEQFRILILPDHPTPVCKRTHTKSPVPYLLYKSDQRQSGQLSYNEKTGKSSGLFIKKGYTLINRLLGE